MTAGSVDAVDAAPSRALLIAFYWCRDVEVASARAVELARV
jgi:hypothetical protein